jgi:hypothetical protein
MKPMAVRVFLVIASLALVVTACGDDDTTTTESTEAIVFSEGVIPDSVPESFPIPPDAVIGTTLVDKINNRTEFRMTITSDMETTVRFFQVGLVNQGYVITSSEGNAAEWTMTFSTGELTGSIFTTPQGGGFVTTSVLSFNAS